MTINEDDDNDDEDVDDDEDVACDVVDGDDDSWFGHHADASW